QDKLNRDIIIIDGLTRLPYSLGQENKKRKTILVINIQNHFESVGRLITEKNIKRVQREFFSDDDIVTRALDFLNKGNTEKSSSECTESTESSDEESSEESSEEEYEPDDHAIRRRLRKEKEKRMQNSRKMDRKRNAKFSNFYH